MYINRYNPVGFIAVTNFVLKPLGDESPFDLVLILKKR